jgi:hypothetical protein
MRVLIRTGLILAAVAALAACGTATMPHPRDPPATAMPPGAASGSRAEATALGGLLLSKLRLPPGTLPRPAQSLPPSLSEPALGCAGCTTDVDVHQLFAVAEPAASVVATLSAHAPAGMSLAGAGREWGPGPAITQWQEVGYAATPVPAGIAWARVVVTVVPAASGRSLLRADAQVTWYPPRTFAEYIDPGYYHALTITATSYGHGVHTAHAVVTSQAVITRLAEALDRSPAWPPELLLSCPAELVSYQLAFSVSRHSHPDVVVSDGSCGGTGITVDGKSQPSLDDGGAVAAIAGQALHVTSGR